MSKNRFSLNGDGTGSQPPSDDSERRIATELSKRYKELAALWDDAEERLHKFRVPVDVRVCYESFYADDNQPGAKIHSYLGFVRYGSGWRICWCRNHDDYPEDDFEWKPVVDCRLDVRIAAWRHIDKLREAVLNAAEEAVPMLDKAIAAFQKKLEKW
jgi:hypothetical protein